jgi:hypothetical protein
MQLATPRAIINTVDYVLFNYSAASVPARAVIKGLHSRCDNWRVDANPWARKHLLRLWRVTITRLGLLPTSQWASSPRMARSGGSLRCGILAVVRAEAEITAMRPYLARPIELRDGVAIALRQQAYVGHGVAWRIEPKSERNRRKGRNKRLNVGKLYLPCRAAVGRQRI